MNNTTFWTRVTFDPPPRDDDAAPAVRDVTLNLSAVCQLSTLHIEDGSLRFWSPPLHELHGVVIGIHRTPPRITTRKIPGDDAHRLPFPLRHAIPQTLRFTCGIAIDDLRSPSLDATTLGWTPDDLLYMCRAAQTWYSNGTPWQLRTSSDDGTACSHDIVRMSRSHTSGGRVRVHLQRPLVEAAYVYEVFVPDPETPSAAAALLTTHVWRDTSTDTTHTTTECYTSFPRVARMVSRLRFPAFAEEPGSSVATLQRALLPHGITLCHTTTAHLELNMPPAEWLQHAQFDDEGTAHAESAKEAIDLELNESARAALGACSARINMRSGATWHGTARAEPCPARGRWFTGVVELHARGSGAALLSPFEVTLPRAGGDVNIPLRFPGAAVLSDGLQYARLRVAADGFPACCHDTPITMVLQCTWKADTVDTESIEYYSHPTVL